MSLPCRAALYFHTLRYLRPAQFWGRVAFRLHRPSPDLRGAPPLRRASSAWQTPAARRASMLGPAQFRFLNEEGELPSSGGWNSPNLPKLWLYNLHYFDDLNAAGAQDRGAWHRVLITRWIAENPPSRGVGWEPYPLSLRMVNWVKWTLAGNPLDAAARHSLAVQVRWLCRRLEYHLLGNHLFANAKALVFAGCCFEGDEAEEWRRRGLGILGRELSEQILPDGGHFERSPMYHAVALEDVLDLLNLTRAFPGLVPAPVVATWTETVQRMRRWLAAMCHPDGEIAFFNDAAIDIVPPPAGLEAYARRLGLPAVASPAEDVTHLSDSGYVRVQQGDLVALLDVAPLGPDYLPGHAHADTLSFEMSLSSRRVIVNSGTSCYGEGAERLRQRGTAAHSTVTVDGENSSEVWGGFRVARRAYPYMHSVAETDESIEIVASHNGYRRLKGKAVHRRSWKFTAGSLVIHDLILGNFERAEARFHLHPDVVIDRDGSSDHQLLLLVSSGRGIRFGVQGARRFELADSTWHPTFGVSVPSICIVVPFNGQSLTTMIEWGNNN